MEKPQVHWFYKRVHAQHPTETIYFELSGGLGFLLRRLHLIQPEKITIPGAPPTIVGFPGVGLELTAGTGAIRWQLSAIPADLYSAPRRNNVIVKTETAPFDQLAFGVNLSAVFKPRSHTVNLFYDIGELINIKISGMELLTPPGYYCPDYIDIAAEGYYIP